MAFVEIPADTWTEIVVSTVRTAVQNRGPKNLFVTTESTGGLDRDEGVCLGPLEALVYDSGVTVSAMSVGVAGRAEVSNLGV